MFDIFLSVYMMWLLLSPIIKFDIFIKYWLIFKILSLATIVLTSTSVVLEVTSVT